MPFNILNLRRKKKKPKYDFLPKFVIAMPIPHSENRGFDDKIVVIRHKDISKEFLHDDVIYNILSGTYPAFDLTLRKRMRRLSTLPIGGIETE